MGVKPEELQQGAFGLFGERRYQGYSQPLPQRLFLLGWVQATSINRDNFPGGKTLHITQQIRAVCAT